METNLGTNHVENTAAPTIVHDKQIYSDADLLKAGANEIKEDNVASVQLVRDPLLFFPPAYSLGIAANSSQAAALGTNKPATWGPGHRKLYGMCALVYLCSTMNGYDGSLMGSINAVPSYQQYYGLSANGAASTGIIFAIYQVGQMVGALFIWLADWRGRRLAIFLGVCGVVISEFGIWKSRVLFNG